MSRHQRDGNNDRPYPGCLNALHPKYGFGPEAPFQREHVRGIRVPSPPPAHIVRASEASMSTKARPRAHYHPGYVLYGPPAPHGFIIFAPPPSLPDFMKKQADIPRDGGPGGASCADAEPVVALSGAIQVKPDDDHDGDEHETAATLRKLSKDSGIVRDIQSGTDDESIGGPKLKKPQT